MFDVENEPCDGCGREVEECVCPDTVLDDADLDLDDADLDLDEDPHEDEMDDADADFLSWEWDR